MQLRPDTIAKISGELTHEFGATAPVWVITSVAANAVRDLRGSIAVEALPEMAIRLAWVRLAERFPTAERSLVGAGAARVR